MSESQPGQPERRPQDPFVAQNRPEPAQRAESLRVLQGFWGDSDRPGYRRLYFGRGLDAYAEFREGDVVNTGSVGPDRSQVPGEPATRVALRGDAMVDITRERRAQELSPFDIDLQFGQFRSASSDLGDSQGGPCILGATPGDVTCETGHTDGTCYGQLSCVGFGSCDPGCSFDCPPDPVGSDDLNPC